MDRAALDVAIELGIPHGGWCPLGREAEDGPIPPKYQLKETPLKDTIQRTEWNVRDSDGTLILVWGNVQETKDGTTDTQRLCRQLLKPIYIQDLESNEPKENIIKWALENQIKVLNVAGPRQNFAPYVYDESKTYLASLFSQKVIFYAPGGEK